MSEERTEPTMPTSNEVRFGACYPWSVNSDGQGGFLFADCHGNETAVDVVDGYGTGKLTTEEEKVASLIDGLPDTLDNYERLLELVVTLSARLGYPIGDNGGLIKAARHYSSLTGLSAKRWLGTIE